MSRLRVLDLGLAPYEDTQELQAGLCLAVAEQRLPGLLLLLEHPPVITLGARGTDSDLVDGGLGDTGHPLVPVVRSVRGGGATLHAPGQLVSYPVVPVPRRDLRLFVRSLEEVVVRVLAEYGVRSERSAGRPGVYVGEAKIASVGLRCRRWVSSHGTSLNVSIDLDLFDRIVSCGEPDLRQTSVLALTGVAPPMDEVKRLYAARFCEVFDLECAELETATLGEVGALI